MDQEISQAKTKDPSIKSPDKIDSGKSKSTTICLRQGLLRKSTNPPLHIIIPKEVSINNSEIKVSDTTELDSTHSISIQIVESKIQIQDSRYSNFIPVKIKNKSETPIPFVTNILKRSRTEEAKSNIKKWITENFDLGKELREVGDVIHKNMEEFFMGKLVLGNEQSTGYLTSLSKILPEISNPIAMESFVYNTTYQYGGYFDCLATFKGKLVLIDWKCSHRQRLTLQDTYDYPIQIAAYIGAVNHDTNYNGIVPKIRNGLLIIANRDGSFPNIFELDFNLIQNYWLQFKERFEKYKSMNKYVSE